MASRLRTKFPLAALPLLVGATAAAPCLAGATGGTVAMAAAAATVAESAGTLTVNVARTGGSSGAATVIYQTQEGTTTPGVNYVAEKGGLSWADGDSAPKAVTIKILNGTPFAGTKTFLVDLSGATGATLGALAATTITINGSTTVAPAQVSMSAAAYTVAENVGSVTLNVARTGSASAAASVGWHTQGVTATVGLNYTGANGTLNWAAGDLSPKAITIQILNGTSFVGAKTVMVDLVNASGAVLGTQAASTVTINGVPKAGTANVSWTAPTENTDGTTITDLAGYNVYYGSSATAMTNVVAVNSPSAVSEVINNLASGTWYVAVTAYDSQAVESAKSATVAVSL